MLVRYWIEKYDKDRVNFFLSGLMMDTDDQTKRMLQRFGDGRNKYFYFLTSLFLLFMNELNCSGQ